MKKAICLLICLLICTTIITVPVCALDMLPPELWPIEIENLDEYDQYVEKTKFYYDFISYEELSYLGDFKYFRHQINNSTPELFYWINVFEDLNIGVSIYYDRFPQPEKISGHINIEPTTSDLRYQPVNARYLHNENIIYTYYRSRHTGDIVAPFDPNWRSLQAIYLKFDDKVVVIGISKEIVEADMPSDHPLQKFLNKETVDEAYAEFLGYIAGELEPPKREPQSTAPISPEPSKPTDTEPAPTEQNFFDKLKSFDFGCKSVISGGVMTAVICGGAALVLLPKKKKR